MTSAERKYIDKNKLIRIFKRFKRQPNKVFVARDFVTCKKGILRDKYFHTLITLGLIEQVSAIYKAGRNFKAKREVKGYKLLTKEKK